MATNHTLDLDRISSLTVAFQNICKYDCHPKLKRESIAWNLNRFIQDQSDSPSFTFFVIKAIWTYIIDQSLVPGPLASCVETSPGQVRHLHFQLTTHRAEDRVLPHHCVIS